MCARRLGQLAKGGAWPFLFLILIIAFGLYASFSLAQEKRIAQQAAGNAAGGIAPTAEVAVENNQTAVPRRISTAKAQEPGVVKAVTLPPQGLYESCLPKDASCLERLAEMGSKGFKIVLNDGLRYAENSASLTAYADAVQKLGMKFILPVKYSAKWDEDSEFLVKKFPELSREGGCKNNAEYLVYYLNAVKGHPALWGYYIADEVHVEDYQGLKRYADLVKRIDPTLPRLIVEEGTNDPMELFFTFPSSMQDVADVLGVDNYPYGFIDTHTALTRFTGASARLTQAWSEKLGIKSAMVLQAYAQPQYYDLTRPLCLPWPGCAPFPGFEQMKAQRDQVILNADPEIILWFSYPDILSSDQPAKHWADLTAAAFAPLPAGTRVVPAPLRQDCPLDWFCEDLGFPERQGTQSLADGAWMIEGVGKDIWSTYMKDADQFHYVWQKKPDLRQMQVRLISQRYTDNAAKAGLMVRKTFDPVSPYYAVLAKAGEGIFVQYRSAVGKDPMRTRMVARKIPVYLKIVRDEDAYSAYVSDNAQDWMLLPGSRIHLPELKGFQMAGLAVSSGSETTTSTVDFDQMSIQTLDE